VLSTPFGPGSPFPSFAITWYDEHDPIAEISGMFNKINVSKLPGLINVNYKGSVKPAASPSPCRIRNGARTEFPRADDAGMVNISQAALAFWGSVSVSIVFREIPSAF